MNEYIFWILPIMLFIAVLVVRKDTKRIIRGTDKIQRSLDLYIKKEQKR